MPRVVQIRELNLPFEGLPPMPRWIYTRHGLQRVPPSAQTMLRDLLDPDSLYRPVLLSVLRDYLFGRPRPAHITDESLGATLARRLNRKTVDDLASAMMHGVYAGDIWKLSTPAVMPLPWDIDGTAKSVWAAPAEALARVTAADAEDMKKIPQETYEMYIQQVHGTMATCIVGGLDRLVAALETVLRLSGSVEFKMETEVKELNVLHSEGKVEVTRYRSSIKQWNTNQPARSPHLQHLQRHHHHHHNQHKNRNSTSTPTSCPRSQATDSTPSSTTRNSSASPASPSASPTSTGPTRPCSPAAASAASATWSRNPSTTQPKPSASSSTRRPRHARARS
jgi:hypothetical protein